MPGQISPVAMAFSGLRLAYVLLGLAGVALLWKRPRPQLAAALLLCLNVAAWAAYVAPLGKLYALGERNDRAFNAGMAACVAAGNSPWDHTQVGHAGLEPFWDVLVAALAGFDPARVVVTYSWLSPLALAIVVLGLFWGLRQNGDSADAWERVLLVLAVVGLSSMSMSQKAPLPPLWAGSFLLKPNHAAAWGVVAVVMGMRARGARWWIQGLTLGLLAWVFVVNFGYTLVALTVGEFLRPRHARRWYKLAAASVVGCLVATPLILNLARDYSPFGAGDSPAQVWAPGALGMRLTLPHWVTTDFGLLLVLAVAGGFVLARRARPRDRVVLGFLVTVCTLWLLQEFLALFGFYPEPDDFHYFLRFVVAIVGGAGLAAVARHVEAWQGLSLGQGHLIVLAACLPLTFPAYWDPPSMDRYWDTSPIDERISDYARWIRDNTPPDAVFLGGPSSSSWIPVLAGRRVLLAGDSRPPVDYVQRKHVERVMLTSRDPDLTQKAARRYGVTHLAIDRGLMREYDIWRFKRPGLYDVLYRSKLIKIMGVRKTGPTGHEPAPRLDPQGVARGTNHGS